ncbi:MAG: CvpA family protein [Rhodoferax sp.]|nr:CvpA family protein [Rhodoferax sp.]
MPTLDWLFLALLLGSMLVGAWRGLVYEMLALLNWVVAFMLAQWFAPMAAKHLPLGEVTEIVRYAAGFVLVFVASLFVGGLLAFLVRKLMAAVGLRPVDRALGAVFGLVRGGIVLLVLVVLVGMTPLHRSKGWQDSVGTSLATGVLRGMKPVLPPDFAKYLPA